MGAADTGGRILASLFHSGPVAPSFSCCLDVPNGGVLLGLAGLLHMGLLRHTGKYFQLPGGYYALESIFLLLAFMTLARIKTIESLRYCSPGEWGKLLGLDRIPEARTLRRKMHLLTQDGQATQWGSELSRDWMGMFPESAGVLYIDGHVRVYNGGQTELPRHHVARQKLCLRATTDYWVNAMDGQPFFMVNKVVDPGLLTVQDAMEWRPCGNISEGTLEGSFALGKSSIVTTGCTATEGWCYSMTKFSVVTRTEIYEWQCDTPELVRSVGQGLPFCPL